MGAVYLVPGWGAVNGTGTSGALIPGGGYAADTTADTTAVEGGGASEVSSSFSGAWSVRAGVAASLSGSWGVRASVAASISGAWTVRKRVATSATGAWSIAAAGIASTTVAGSWTVRNLASTTVAGSWTVRNLASASVAGSWSVLNAVAPVTANVGGIGNLTYAGTAAVSVAVVPVVIKTVTMVMTTDGLNPAANLSNLSWAWFDSATPNLMTAPANSGATATTDASGKLTLVLPNSTRTGGQVGWLVVSNSNGSPTQNPPASAFSGPVTVDL